MSRRSRRNMLRLSSALSISPFLLVILLAGGYVVKTLNGSIVEDLNQKELLDTVIESEEDIIVEEEIEEVTVEIKEEPKVLEEVKENVEEEVIESTIEEIPYPEISELNHEYNISSNMLEEGYEFQNIDFETLKDINEDSCAWLSVDGTNINLPIVQGDDNKYYLDHDIEGNESKYGTLYVDYRNNPLDVPNSDLSDFTIVYGHHMSGGKMLAPICNYKSQSFYDNHKFGVVYTPDGYAYEAKFFAGVIIEGIDDSEIFTSDIIDSNMYDAYIDNIRKNSTFESDVEVEYGDKVIALVTCSYETGNSRYVLYAVLNKQYINENEMINQKGLGL